MLGYFLGSISESDDAMHASSSLQAFESELRVNEQRLSTLNHLSHELITQYHKDDDSQDLKDAMTNLNVRWRKMLEG